jgi:regulator of ribosome biosynthesis
LFLILVSYSYILCWTGHDIYANVFRTDLEAYLLDRSTRTTQHLLQTLFTLPLTRTPTGPFAQLPVSHSHAILPREKHLPKPKPLTKWERFAKEKGISHKKKDKMVWDEDLSDWVPRWGKGGKNKDVEEAWIREVKQGDGECQIPWFWQNDIVVVVS